MITRTKIHRWSDELFTLLNKDLNYNFDNSFISGTMQTYRLIRPMRPLLAVLPLATKSQYESEEE
jgi:hypothetical protein